MSVYPPPAKLFSIKAARVRGTVMIFTDEDGYVWVMGDNYRKSLGVNTSELMIEPVRTSIKLTPYETVIQSYHHGTLFSITTSHKRLFISRVIDPVLYRDPYIGPMPSACFSMEAGFAEPILEVDEVLNIGETVIFRKGLLHHVYNWRLSVVDTVALKLGSINTNVNTHISFILIMHHANLFYYNICFPFEVDAFEYGRNYIHTHSGLTHHIISLPSINVSNANTQPLAWRCFETEVETMPDYIYVSSSQPYLIVTKDDEAYEYDCNCTTLQRIISNSQFFILNQDDSDEPIPAFATQSGSLTSYGGYEYCTPADLRTESFQSSVARTSEAKASPDLINNVISIVDNHISGITFILVDVDSSDCYALYEFSLYINVRYLAWHQRLFNGVLTYSLDGELRFYTAQTFANSPQHMELIDSIPIAPYFTFSIYRRVEHLQGSVIVQASSSIILFRTQCECYAYSIINGEPCLYEEIRLEHKLYTEIDYDLIEYPLILDANKKHYLFVDPQEAHLGIFAVATLRYPPRSNIEVMYCVENTITALGDGVRREFIQSALNEFAKYLTKHGLSTAFNLVTFEDFIIFMPIIYGHMLHAAITLLQNYLPFHLPIAVLAALLNREPSDLDLESIAFKQNPQAFLKIYPYKHHTNFEDFGFSSYSECLRSLVYYAPLDARSSYVSKQIADGMGKYSSIDGIEDMNFVTLDYYLSGEYITDRQKLKSRISGPEMLVNLIYYIIDNCTEEQLSSLLRNWSGYSTILDVKYLVADGGDGVRFHTCFYVFELSVAFVEERLRLGLRDELVDLIIRPINNIVD